MKSTSTHKASEYKCWKCGAISDTEGGVCVAPMVGRTSGICGGSYTNEGTIKASEWNTLTNTTMKKAKRMKARELRIGNWIEWEDDSHDQFQVETIGYQCGNYFINGGFLIDMLPIPLTPEWLERLEFSGGDGRWTIQYPLENWIMRIECFEGYIVSHGFMNEFSELRNIKYVHQLQNLYYALTGQELKNQKKTNR